MRHRSQKERGRHRGPPLERPRKKSLKAASVKQRVAGTRVVATTVPASFQSPIAPTLVIIGRGIWVSGFNRSTIGALVLLHPAGYGVPSHRRSYEHRRNDCGRAKQYELCHAYLPFALLLMTKLRREQTFRTELLKETLSVRAAATCRPPELRRPACIAVRLLNATVLRPDRLPLAIVGISG
jgi:hypothetical protein